MHSADTASIHPGETFLDADGKVAQLHGVGIQRFGDLFYAWGEDKRAGSRFTAVACYSSPDLVSWTFEGNSLEPGEGDLTTDVIVERPKVLRRPDGRFVLFFHLDSEDYSVARVGYAVADNAVGPFTWVGSERPLGNASRDIGVYQEDGIGYLLSEDRDNGLHIYQLADDYLSVRSALSTTLKDDRSHGYESPALIKHEGLYYLFGSDLTGWATNDNKVSTAPALHGPWSTWSDIAVPDSATFDSQISTIVPYESAAGLRYMYVGDRWRSDDLSNSPAVWLPISIGNGRATVEWADAWRPGSGADPGSR